MTIEMLLKRLRQLKKEHGNIDVMVEVTYNHCHAEDCCCYAYPDEDKDLETPEVDVRTVYGDVKVVEIKP